MAICKFLIGLCVVVLARCHAANAQETGYRKEVSVSAPTRLDWTFALANQSRVEPPADWLRGYDSTEQRYERYVPPKPKDRTHGSPVILFISAGDVPAGWGQLESVCKARGILFASPFGAGNGTPMPRRVKIVLDVLDDLRREHPIDPDRTYIAGFSGGGRVACAIAFSLPELFGGVISVCAGGELREESWLRHRAMDRLSVALITGSGDFNQGEIARFCGPLFTDVGIRTQVTDLAKLGHGIPQGKAWEPVLEWLDKGASARRELADKRPASRIEADQAPDRAELAKALFSEGEARIKQRATIHSGLMQLQGVMTRWPDLPIAEEAKRVLLEHENRNERPWEEDDIAEQRKFLIARARAVDAYATGTLSEQYQKQRPNMLKAAAALWQQVLDDGQDPKAVSEAKRRLPVIAKLIEEK